MGDHDRIFARLEELEARVKELEESVAKIENQHQEEAWVAMGDDL